MACFPITASIRAQRYCLFLQKNLCLFANSKKMEPMKFGLPANRVFLFIISKPKNIRILKKILMTRLVFRIMRLIRLRLIKKMEFGLELILEASITIKNNTHSLKSISQRTIKIQLTGVPSEKFTKMKMAISGLVPKMPV